VRTVADGGAGRRRGISRQRCRPALEQGLQHIPLAAKTRCLADGEPGGGKAVPHLPGDGEGAGGGSRSAQSRHPGEQFRAPEFGVFCRGEAVEEPGVGHRIGTVPERRVVAGGKVVEAGDGVGQYQGQAHPVAIEPAAVKARYRRRVVVGQLAGQTGECRPAGQRLAEVGAAQRKFFQRYIVETAVVGRQRQPEVDGGEKIEPAAEAGFDDRETTARREVRPAGGQLIAGDEHVAAFGQAVVAGVVDVAERCRYRLSFGPFDGGGDDHRGGARAGRGRVAVGHGARPNSTMICSHQRARRASLRSNSFSSSRARPTKCRRSALSAFDPLKR